MVQAMSYHRPFIRHHFHDDLRYVGVVNRRSLLRGGGFSFGSILGSIGKIAQKVLPFAKAVAPSLINVGVDALNKKALENPQGKLAKVAGIANTLAPVAQSLLQKGNGIDELENSSKLLLEDIMKRGKSVRVGTGAKSKKVGKSVKTDNVISTRL